MTKPHHIAYIMSRFPGLSETFILREMCALEELGWQLELYPLIVQNESIVHDEARSWIPRAHRPSLFEVLIANLLLFFTRPVTSISIYIKMIAGNINSPRFLARAIVVWPKAVWMARNMTKNGIDHIHAHYATHPALAAWIVNQLTNIPYSVTVHAHDIFVDKSMLFQKLQDARQIVAISQYNREYLINYAGSWIAEKIQVIHCGIVPELYTSDKVTGKSFGEIFEILSIGSLRPYKGFTYLLDACQILKQRDFPFRCRIVGSGVLYDALLERIINDNLQNCVELLGGKSQSEVAYLLKSADCYIQPSVIIAPERMEGIPVSLMEAMASELPVIATDISGIPELVQPNATGILVPPEDPQALANAIMEVQANPTKAMSCAKSGKDLVLKEFNILSSVALLSKLFDTIIEGIP